MNRFREMMYSVAALDLSPIVSALGPQPPPIWSRLTDVAVIAAALGSWVAAYIAYRATRNAESQGDLMIKQQRSHFSEQMAEQKAHFAAQMEAQSEYNRANVRPRLQMAWTTRLTPRHDGVGLFLENRGLGPAEILSIQGYVDRAQVTEGHPGKFWDQIGQALGIKDNGSIAYELIEPGDVMEAGTPHLFWGRTATSRSTEAWRQMEEHVGRVGIGISYCSVYPDAKYNARWGLLPEDSTDSTTEGGS